MSDPAFKSLDPNIRAYALVGCFLQHWALMERSTHEAIAKALDLTTTQSAIVCANIQFRDKTNILKTAVSISLISPETRDGYTKTLNEMANYSPTRNMMAHDLFMASEDGEAVEFAVTKAKGKLDFPEVIWTVGQFEDAYARLDFYRMKTRLLTDELQRAALIDAVLSAPSFSIKKQNDSTDDTFWPGLLGLPFPPLPTGHTSDTNPANPETEDKTSPDPKG